MDRRIFLKDISMASAAAALGPIFAFGKNIAPTFVYKPLGAFEIAMTLAQMGLGAGKMFQGNSSSGVADLQIQMFKVISAQLNLIKDGIVAIQQNIQELKDLIGNIPDAVVEALNRNTMLGNIGRYDQLMATYEEYNKNTRRFLQQHRGQVEDLKNAVGVATSQLKPIENYLNIPLLCSALYIEHNCMVLLDDPIESIRPMTNGYKIYLTSVMYTRANNLEKIIAETRKERDNALTKIKASRSFLGMTKPNVKSFDYGTCQFEYKYDNSKKTAIDELVRLGLIENSERPIEITPKYETLNTLDTRFVYKAGKWGDPAPKQLLKNVKEGLNNEAQKLQGEYNLKTLKLYTALSCLYAGNRAVNFCNQF